MQDHHQDQSIREEHRELYGALKALRNLVDGNASLHGQHWAARLRGELHWLSPRLTRHFHREEVGFYLTIRDARPTLGRQLDRFLRDHGELLAELKAIVNRTLRYPEGPLRQEIEGRLRLWLDRLEAHEKREMELLSDAVLRDIGAGD